jgi:glycosyltransferase involved in cell wall biosynthesis
MAAYRPDPVFFPRAVQSVLKQTIHDLELVIVEDPSPRSAGDLLADFHDPRIRHLVNSVRTSLVAQRNRCIAEARSDLVAILDADDVAQPDRLERQWVFLTAHPDIDVVGSQLAIIDHDDRHLGYRTYPLDHDSIMRVIRKHSPFAQNTVLFNKQAVLQAGGYGYSYNNTAEDYDLWSRLALQGTRFANLPYPLVQYRIHSGQMKATHLKDTIRGVLEVKRRYWRQRMTLTERAQMLGEACLLRLPAGLVLNWLIRYRWLRHNGDWMTSSSEEATTCERAAEALDMQASTLTTY